MFRVEPSGQTNRVARRLQPADSHASIVTGSVALLELVLKAVSIARRTRHRKA